MHLLVPPHQISSCPAPDGSGKRTPLTNHKSSHALCPGVHLPVAKKSFKFSVLLFNTEINQNTCCSLPDLLKLTLFLLGRNTQVFV